MNEIQNLLAQVRILEQQAANKTGVERRELQKAAARVKMQIIKLLPERGQQQQESKVPDPNEYFGAKLPDGFEDYFPAVTSIPKLRTTSTTSRLICATTLKLKYRKMRQMRRKRNPIKQRYLMTGNIAARCSTRWVFHANGKEKPGTYCRANNATNEHE